MHKHRNICKPYYYRSLVYVVVYQEVLREAIKKKKVHIFGLCSKKGGTKPTFLHKDNLRSNFKGRGG